MIAYHCYYNSWHGKNMLFLCNSNPGCKVFIVLPGEHERMKNIVQRIFKIKAIDKCKDIQCIENVKINNDSLLIDCYCYREHGRQQKQQF